ncbi:MAG: cyclic nucleotide-binding domain-containing protein [Myxococcota bacterium]
MSSPLFPSRPPTPRELKKNLAELKEVVLKHPLDLDARLRIARTYRLLGKTKQAVAHYRSVARYLALAGQPLQAIAVSKEQLQVAPDDNETLLFLAKLYARTRGASNAGRVAVPIPSDPVGDETHWPSTATGVWRAIRPAGAVKVLSLDEVGGRVDSPLVPPPLPPDGDVSGEQALSVDESDVVAEEEHADESVVDVDTGDIQEEEEDPSGEGDLSENYEILGPLTDGDLVLPELPLFSGLSQANFVELSAALTHKTAKAGELVWKEGDDAGHLAILVEGEAVAFRGSGDARVNLAHLRSGDFAGLFALLSERLRAASLEALTDLSYFELRRSVVERLVKEHPAFGLALRDFLRERVVANALALLPVFRELEPGARLVLAQGFKTKIYRDGDELFYQGAGVNGLWVIMDGTVNVGTEKDNGELDVTRKLPSGHFLGTVAALEGAETDAAAVADGDVTTVTLSTRALKDLADAHPALKELRAPLAAAGLSITERVFGGTAQLPSELSPAFLQPKPAP